MFKDKKSAAASSSTPLAVQDRGKQNSRLNNVPSIISADMTVSGDLRSDGDLQIEGKVVGDINVAKLVIADGGNITGDIIANDVRICGALTGSVRAKTITLTATARVTGDLHHEVLAIEAGGRLEGQSRRLLPQVELAPSIQENAVPAEDDSVFAAAGSSQY